MKWEVKTVAWGMGMTRYENTIEVWADDEEEAEIDAKRETKRRLGNDVAVDIVSVKPDRIGLAIQHKHN